MCGYEVQMNVYFLCNFMRKYTFNNFTSYQSFPGMYLMFDYASYNDAVPSHQNQTRMYSYKFKFFIRQGNI